MLDRSRPLILIAALLAPLFALAPGCSTNPATGRSQLNLMSREEEIALGAEAMPELIQQYGGEIGSAQLRSYVTDIGATMAAYTEAENPSLPWEFTLLDSDVINAFALPGGKVFMSRGLAERLDNEAQLAGVLGHEIGHVTARHANERISRQLLISGIAVGAVVAAGQSDNDAVKYGVPVAVGVGGQGYLLKFGRSQELEADQLGMRYMSRAGYDPMGQMQVMQVLAEASQGPRQPELLSTHPHPESRIEQIQNLLATEYAYTQNNPAFELKTERYQNLFLSRLAALPPPEHSGFALASAASWCALCAADQAADEPGHAAPTRHATQPIP